MPWTRRQVRYLLSQGSPLNAEEKAKMKSELHANPEMGRMRKGRPRTSSRHDGFLSAQRAIERRKR